MSSKVAVSKPLLAGLAGVAAVAVLGIVFLLGRETARNAQPGPRPEAGTGADPAPALGPQAPVPQADLPALAGLVPASAPLAPAPAAPAPPAAVPPANHAERDAVAAYFKAVDRLQPEQKGDPESVAQQIAAGVSKGDTSGLDGMDQQARAARSRMASLTPPPSCAAFHQESLALMDAGQELMLGLKKAMATPDAAQMGELSDRANALKARTEALRAQEAAIRRQFGL